MIENIRVRITFWEDGHEYGLEEKVSDPSNIQDAVEFIMVALKHDYNARHKGENTLWP